MISLRSICVAIVFCAIGFPQTAWGQISATTDIAIGGVSGSGYGVIRRPPELLRMHLNLVTSSGDAASALKSLRAYRDDVVQFCTDLGAAKESLVVSSPRIVPDSAERQQLLAQVRQRSRGAAGKNAGSLVNASLWITVEWPLSANAPDQLLDVAATLSEKIKTGMAKIKAKQPLSPEEQELQEELAGQSNSNNNEARPGTPILLFVAKVPPDALAKALADAYASAKNRADTLCQAIGAARGDLQKMWDSDVNTTTSGAVAQLLAQFDSDNPERDIDNRTEVVGINPGDVTRMVEVDATFRIGK